MRAHNMIAPELLVPDDGTRSMQVRVPVVDVTEGHLIVRDGLFATKTERGSVVGYASRSWGFFLRDEFAQVLKRATNIRGMIVPDRHIKMGYADGFLVQLQEDDAYMYGVDLTEVNFENESFVGCIAISSTAYLFAISGLYPNMIGGPNASDSVIRATEVKQGVIALRLGSFWLQQAIPARGEIPACPPMNFPAFPAGDFLRRKEPPTEGAKRRQ